ncbi:MAG: hypothetical protein KDD70_16860, partial [Bdellovibrionales bacterium]|nr:hypothetical protein [Bdellovibrionales bacterium]
QSLLAEEDLDLDDRLTIEDLRHASAGFMQKLHGKHGLVSLALEEGEDGTFQGVPFVVPGGRFNEMYGWDSYFISLGLLEDGKADLAKSMKDNFIYQLTHYGKILNANRSYYFNRSQPPFTSSLILEVYEALPRSPENLAWLQRGLEAAMNEYHEVWMAAPRLGPTGLSHYGGESVGEPIETEEGHFDWLYDELAAERGISVDELREQYAKGTLVVPELDNFFRHDCAVRESGHDTTSRWRVDGVDRCADFAPVDLNSLLYKTEMDFATALEEHFGGSFVRSDGKVEAASDWLERAAKRKTIMMELLWDEAEGCFFDFDTKAQVRHPYMSATALYPLWASRPDDMLGGILNEKQASRLVARVLPELEVAGGLCSTSEASVLNAGVAPGDRQWDFPQGWAPHQLIAWKGLAQYGMNSDAERLAYRWMYTIASNIVKYNGTVPEKYDVVNRTHAVMSEYGNVGTDFRYITREGFGWMNASFQIGKRYIGEKKALLNRLVEPELLS